MRNCIVVAALIVAGCVTPDAAPRFASAWDPFEPEDETGWLRTKQALLVADCQIHNLYSEPVPERNLSSEALAATAIRAPQLDLFAADVLTWILTDGAPDADVVIHLGDACDLACVGEFRAFVDIMDAGGRPWLMAPGNHDFYYFGTYDPQRLELWEAACSGAEGPMHKNDYIRMYVAALVRQESPAFDALGEALGVGPGEDLELDEIAALVPDEFEWRRPQGSEGLLSAICWELDSDQPWRSFILQEVDMSVAGMEPYANHVILLDSCQYDRRPEMIPNAWQSYPAILNCGLSGQMLPGQMRKLRAWVEAARADQVSVSMACHHPFEVLEPRTKASLGWLWREYEVSLMMSAHTHSGYFAHHDLGGDRDELELNIGSTTDWPMEWRTVQGWVNPGQQEIYITAERHLLVDELIKRGEGWFERGWEIPRDAPDDYRKYKQGRGATSILLHFYLAYHVVPYWMQQPLVKPNAATRETEEQVKDTLLWTYQRLITLFPTGVEQGGITWPAGCNSDAQVQDAIEALAQQEQNLVEKSAFLKELAAFEHSRPSVDLETGESLDAVRMRYKLSQAAWASRFDASDGRRLRVEDELIRLDWDRTLVNQAAAGRTKGPSPDSLGRGDR